MATDHNNTDHSNAFCNCRLGENHGNLPADQRELVLRAMLRGLDVEFASDSAYTLVTPVEVSGTPKVFAALRSFGFEPLRRSSWEPGGRGLRIAAAAFVR